MSHYANLPQVLRSSTGSDLVNKLIKRNDISSEILSVQKELIEIDNMLNEIKLNACNSKKHILENMNAILRDQIDNFDEETNKMYMDCTNDLNEIDRLDDNVKNLLDRKMHLNARFYELLNNFAAVDQQIPSSDVIINIRATI
jgi:t-SNARE complex subunit (syntaxin)